LNTAAEQVANERDYEAGAHESVNKSDILRDALTEYFEQHYDELPEEARDLLDDDLVADAGGTEDDGLRADKFECASCGETFIDAETASKHTAREHPESDPNIAEVEA
jgi:hypothetical protein